MVFSLGLLTAPGSKVSTAGGFNKARPAGKNEHSSKKAAGKIRLEALRNNEKLE